MKYCIKWKTGSGGPHPKKIRGPRSLISQLHEKTQETAAPKRTMWGYCQKRETVFGLQRPILSFASVVAHVMLTTLAQHASCAVHRMSAATKLPQCIGIKRRRKTIMSSAHMLVATKELVLTEQELQVLRTLKQVVSDEKLDTVVRVAGGWVRDKLIGRENHDLDITLDDMTGAQFARMVHQHLTKTGQETSSVAVIQANPERSKHLETATTKVHGKELDFVNLRSEEYTSESRIPTMVSVVLFADFDGKALTCTFRPSEPHWRMH